MYYYKLALGFGQQSGRSVIDGYLNFQPNIDIIKGTEAILKPFVVNGQIKSITVKNGGKDYFDTPDIEILGDGYGAYAKAIISNGQIVSVKIIQEGIGYSQFNTQAKLLGL